MAAMYSAIVFALCVATTLAYNCDNAPDTNGCNVWSWFPFRSTFAPACNKHDVCYSCGFTFDISKSECDDAFLQNMNDICRTSYCREIAKVYYLGVDNFGIGYKKPSASWCRDEEWYRTECLP